MATELFSIFNIWRGSNQWILSMRLACTTSDLTPYLFGSSVEEQIPVCPVRIQALLVSASCGDVPVYFAWNRLLKVRPHVVYDKHSAYSLLNRTHTRYSALCSCVVMQTTTHFSDIFGRVVCLLTLYNRYYCLLDLPLFSLLLFSKIVVHGDWVVSTVHPSHALFKISTSFCLLLNHFTIVLSVVSTSVRRVLFWFYVPYRAKCFIGINVREVRDCQPRKVKPIKS